MFVQAFFRNAFLAGTFVALACGCVGWFAVLRGQLFAGDALGHVAFVGAIAAAVVGVDARAGLFALTVMVALSMASLGRRAQADDAVIGTVLAWVLGIGLLLLSILATSAAGGTGVTAANTLFGSIYSLSGSAAMIAAVIGLAVTIAVAGVVRPLLFATLDAELAAARGVPVRLLGVAMLVALAAVTAEGTQAVGALLVLGLLAAPAGAAHRLTPRPYVGLAAAAGFAMASMWGGLILSYAVGSLPPSTAVIGIAAAIYAAASLIERLRR